MNSPTGSRMIVGLDIGTSKVVTIVAEIGFDSEIEIVGIDQGCFGGCGGVVFEGF